MRFKTHFIIGLLTSTLIYFIFNLSPFAWATIFLSSFLIDFDHYFWYSAETGDWNPFHAIRWYLTFMPRWKKISKEKRKKFKGGIFIFHSLPFWILLAVLSFFNLFFFWILIGVMIHMIADLTDLVERKENVQTKIFPFYSSMKNKNKKPITSF